VTHSRGRGDALAMAQECRDLTRDVMQGCSNRRGELRRERYLLLVTLWMLFAKACDTFDAVRELCSKRWGHEALILLRVLLETTAIAKFILKHSVTGLYLYLEGMKAFNDRWLQWVGFDVERGVTLEAKLPEAIAAVERENSGLAELLSGVLGEPPRSDKLAWNKRGKRKRWGPETKIEDVFREADMEHWYETVYRLAAFWSHAHVGINKDYLKADDSTDNVTAVVGPKAKWAGAALQWACQVLLMHLETVSDAFGLDEEARITVAKKRLAFVEWDLER